MRDQHKLCIEDPFQLDYNVARTVTRDGLYTVGHHLPAVPASFITDPANLVQIRGEFIRAHRILASRSHERISSMINEVCEEREDFIVQHPPANHSALRRRSAPSPRMHSAALPQPPLPAAMSEFRLWAALNGVNGGGAGRSSGGGDPRLYNSTNVSNGPQREARGRAGGMDEAWDPSSPPQPHSYYPGGYHRPPPPLPYRHHLESQSQPASTPTSPPRVPVAILDAEGHDSVTASWDDSKASSTTASYDMHRFFQNQPGEAVEQAITTPSSGSVSVSTAPPSPDLNLAMHADYYGPGRAPYRYPPPPQINPHSNYSDGRHFVNPRMTSSSLPRQTHSSLYRSSPQQQSAAQLGPAPTAIFPVADREVIAQANSITFGNFGPPGYGLLPDYSHFVSPDSSHTSPLVGSGSVFGLLEDDDDDPTGGEESSLRGSGRGRRPNGNLPAVFETPPALQASDIPEFGQRRRGRSVPMRLGADGREIAMLKFGEVETEFFMPRDELVMEEEEDSLPQGVAIQAKVSDQAAVEPSPNSQPLALAPAPAPASPLVILEMVEPILVTPVPVASLQISVLEPQIEAILLSTAPSTAPTSPAVSESVISSVPSTAMEPASSSLGESEGWAEVVAPRRNSNAKFTNKVKSTAITARRSTAITSKPSSPAPTPLPNPPTRNSSTVSTKSIAAPSPSPRPAPEIKAGPPILLPSLSAGTLSPAPLSWASALKSASPAGAEKKLLPSVNGHSTGAGSLINGESKSST